MEQELCGQKRLGGLVRHASPDLVAWQLAEENAEVIAKDPTLGFTMLSQVLRRHKKSGWQAQEESIEVCKIVTAYLGQQRLDDRFQGRTALQAAAQKGAVDIMKILLEKRASVELADQLQRTPLHLAALAGQGASVQCLLEARASATACDKFGRRPLYYAKGDPATCVEALLAVPGLEADAPDRQGQTALFEAAMRGHASKALALLTAGAEVDAEDVNGQTPLFAAVAQGQVEVCRLLLEANADVEKRDKRNRCALSIASAVPENDEVLALLRKGRRRCNRIVLATKPGSGPLSLSSMEEATSELPEALRHRVQSILRRAACASEPRKLYRFVFKDKIGRRLKKNNEARLQKLCSKAGWSYTMWDRPKKD